MANIITYPLAKPTLSDKVIGSQYDPETGAGATKNFNISSIISLTMANGFQNLPIYAGNEQAIVGGLAVGEVYRTSIGILKVRY